MPAGLMTERVAPEGGTIGQAPAGQDRDQAAESVVPPSIDQRDRVEARAYGAAPPGHATLEWTESMETPAKLEQTLIALERAGWEALTGGRGVAFYQEVFLDEGLMLFPVGTFGKADALQALATAPPWARYELRQLRVLPLSESTASVVYDVEASRAEQPPYRAVMSSTYVWRQGTWKLALHTQTPTS